MTSKRTPPAASAAGLLAITSLAGSAFGSSHREAPLISFDPSSASTPRPISPDLYAFVSPDAPDTVTLIANYHGFQEPSGGPNFDPFNPEVSY